MDQASLLPICITELRPANLGTADCHHIGIAADGVPYAIKRIANNPRVPVSEWICNSLARACSIPVPPFDIVILPGNEQAFGSRWEGGVLSPQQALDVWSRKQPVPDLAERLASVFAFDLFVHNVDRHQNNFWFREGLKGSAPIVLAGDYSRSLLWDGIPIPDPPLPAMCNTMRFRAWFRVNFTAETSHAIDMLDKLESLPMDAMQRLCDKLPPHWVSQDIHQHLLDWWALDRARRLNQIREGFRNGQLV